MIAVRVGLLIMLLARSVYSFWSAPRLLRRRSALSGVDKGSVRNLLGSILDRADRQLSYKEDSAGVRPIASEILSSVKNSLETMDADILNNDERLPAPSESIPRILGTSPIENYGRNPTITMTALAHELWKHVVIPGDTVIDATAGNGGDSLILSKLLFPLVDADESASSSSTSKLLCIDVSEEACKRTRNKLSMILPKQIYEKNVKVLQQSHAPLPAMESPVRCGLAVYNLGYLPSSGRHQLTTTESTIASLADAALMMRVGGMLSVMTYPRTNKPEHEAVRILLEGMALFTSNTHNLVDFVKDSDINESVRVQLMLTLKHIHTTGASYQTWRVHEHRKLGWVDAPTLLTATRVQ